MSTPHAGRLEGGNVIWKNCLKVNASYLSALFSQTTGVTFHHFQEGVRLSKAEELLRVPSSRVGEVACAAGYASPDAFRHAFKAHEGLSPEAWRAGQQVWPVYRPKSKETSAFPKLYPLRNRAIGAGI